MFGKQKQQKEKKQDFIGDLLNQGKEPTSSRDSELAYLLDVSPVEEPDREETIHEDPDPEYPEQEFPSDSPRGELLDSMLGVNEKTTLQGLEENFIRKILSVIEQDWAVNYLNNESLKEIGMNKLISLDAVLASLGMEDSDKVHSLLEDKNLTMSQWILFNSLYYKSRREFPSKETIDDNLLDFYRTKIKSLMDESCKGALRENLQKAESKDDLRKILLANDVLLLEKNSLKEGITTEEVGENLKNNIKAIKKLVVKYSLDISKPALENVYLLAAINALEDEEDPSVFLNEFGSIQPDDKNLFFLQAISSKDTKFKEKRLDFLIERYPSFSGPYIERAEMLLDSEPIRSIELYERAFTLIKDNSIKERILGKLLDLYTKQLEGEKIDKYLAAKVATFFDYNKLDETNQNLLEKRANLYMMIGKKDKALKDFKKMFENDSRNQEAVKSIVEILSNDRKYWDALDFLKNLGVFELDKPYYYTLMSSLYDKVEKVDEALELIEKAEKLEPSNELHKLNKAHLMRKMIDRAGVDEETKIKKIRLIIKTLEQVLPSDNCEVPLRLADLNYEIGEIEEAIEYYKEAISQGTENALLHYNLAMCFAESGMLDFALESIGNFESLAGEELLDDKIKEGVGYMKCMIFGIGEEYESCIKSFEEVADLFKKSFREDPDLFENVGTAYFKLGYYDEAYDALKKAYSIRKSRKDGLDSKILFYLGKSLVKKGMIHTALEHFQEALGKKQDSIETIYEIALIKGKQNKKSEENALYERIIQLGGDSKIISNCYYALAKDKIGSKDKEKAKELLYGSLEQDPSHFESNKELAGLLFDEENWQELSRICGNILPNIEEEKEIHYFLEKQATAFRFMGGARKELKILNRLIEINKLEPLYYSRKATILNNQGKEKEACDVYEEMKRLGILNS